MVLTATGIDIWDITNGKWYSEIPFFTPFFKSFKLKTWSIILIVGHNLHYFMILIIYINEIIL